MHRNLIKLLGRAGVYLEENDGNGNDLGGGNKTAEQIAAEKAEAEAKAKADAEKAEADRIAAEKAKQDQDRNDKPQPSEAEAKLLKEVMERKAKQKELETQLALLTGALGDLKADDIKALVQGKKDAERAELEKRGEYDRIIEQVKTEHAKELEALKGQLAEKELLVTKKDEDLVNLTVGRSFSESAFIREKSLIPASIARKEFGAHVDIVDGVVTVYDKPRGAAERTPLVGADGKAKSFEDGIAALYAAHPEAAAMIRSAAKPGAGSQNADLGGKDPKNDEKQLSGVERIAAGLAKKNQ